ncbi:MAG: MarR family transcriptional regulator, partial [Pseudomonadota bacterium]|nr:MarR family transcriptional regulator [Pseudomonadota bacterium]
MKYKLEDQVGHLMRRANQRHAAIFFEGLNDQQLTPMQFAVLVKIGDEEEVSQNRLGRLAAMDPATVQGVVRRLKERALIDARPDPDDGRRSLWRLSETGEALVAATVPIAE